MTYVLHIAAGTLSLVCGYLALYSAKGGVVHRRSGTVFVYAMLAMAFAGFTMAAVRDVAPALNIPAALLTAYLVITALTTVRPVERGARSVDIGAMLVALGVGVASLTFAVEAFANGGSRRGMPAFPFVMFGVVAMLAAVGDWRMIRAGVALAGTARLARHLWRMCFALFIAALSFFIGQAQVIPKPIRIRPLLAVPVVLVLATMFYWLWRVRFRRSLRGIVLGSHRDRLVSEAARFGRGNSRETQNAPEGGNSRETQNAQKPQKDAETASGHSKKVLTKNVPLTESI